MEGDQRILADEVEEGREREARILPPACSSPPIPWTSMLSSALGAGWRRIASKLSARSMAPSTTASAPTAIRLSFTASSPLDSTSTTTQRPAGAGRPRSCSESARQRRTRAAASSGRSRARRKGQSEPSTAAPQSW